ncbi:hypothetical protein RT41_GL001076 [Lactococcus fujiensis JCM 16395]|uniref:Uncharacterized protein n=1 Tax=Lactococcus fujiensis JCM 16395 TaxID=1291764 RepID=A0A2A5RMZ6_9LACT|nr:hypothetical protein RT41_GL001076 [Lactococcus fujiensis JCM 16395]
MFLFDVLNWNSKFHDYSAHSFLKYVKINLSVLIISKILESVVMDFIY